MCGRFTLTIPNDAIEVLFQAKWETEAAAADWKPRYNIAPESRVPIIAAERGHSAALQRRIRFMKWGLVPSWATDESVTGRMINARAETIDEKPLFRDSFRRRRCLVPSDGFYEWDKAKVPYRLILPGGAPHAYAAIWDRWRSPGGLLLETFSLVTREATPSIRSVHHRMPVILSPHDFDLWLDPENQDILGLKRLLLREPQDTVRAYAVSKAVNAARNDTPECIVAAADMTPEQLNASAAAETRRKDTAKPDDGQMSFW